eukprot:scaffold1300_cov235-Pinguiococcus_pyrenoidosus.AAC.4
MALLQRADRLGQLRLLSSQALDPSCQLHVRFLRRLELFSLYCSVRRQTGLSDVDLASLGKSISLLANFRKRLGKLLASLFGPLQLGDDVLLAVLKGGKLFTELVPFPHHIGTPRPLDLLGARQEGQRRGGLVQVLLRRVDASDDVDARVLAERGLQKARELRLTEGDAGGVGRLAEPRDDTKQREQALVDLAGLPEPVSRGSGEPRTLAAGEVHEVQRGDEHGAATLRFGVLGLGLDDDAKDGVRARGPLVHGGGADFPALLALLHDGEELGQLEHAALGALHVDSPAGRLVHLERVLRISVEQVCDVLVVDLQVGAASTPLSVGRLSKVREDLPRRLLHDAQVRAAVLHGV